MPDLLENPPTKPPQPLPDVLRPFTWTRPEAIEAAKRSVASRQKRAAEKLQNLNAEPTDLSAHLAVNAQLRLVAEQVTRTRALLNDDDFRFCAECERGGVEPQHRAQLLKALDTLLERQRVLLGIPLPGSRRPREDRARVSAGWIELQPALPSPGPQVAPAPTTPEVACLDCLAPTTDVTCCAPAKPLGWEYDDPNVSACGVDTPTGSVPSNNPNLQTPQDAAKP